MYTNQILPAGGGTDIKLGSSISSMKVTEGKETSSNAPSSSLSSSFSFLGGTRRGGGLMRTWLMSIPGEDSLSLSSLVDPCGSGGGLSKGPLSASTNSTQSPKRVGCSKGLVFLSSPSCRPISKLGKRERDLGGSLLQAPAGGGGGGEIPRNPIRGR